MEDGTDKEAAQRRVGVVFDIILNAYFLCGQDSSGSLDFGPVEINQLNGQRAVKNLQTF
jgi:hypothetical protein